MEPVRKPTQRAAPPPTRWNKRPGLIDRIDRGIHFVVNTAAERAEKRLGVKREVTAGAVMLTATMISDLTKTDKRDASHLLLEAFGMVGFFLWPIIMRNMTMLRDEVEWVFRLCRKISIPMAALHATLGMCLDKIEKVGVGVAILGLGIWLYLITSRDGRDGGFWEKEPPRDQ